MENNLWAATLEASRILVQLPRDADAACPGATLGEPVGEVMLTAHDSTLGFFLI